METACDFVWQVVCEPSTPLRRMIHWTLRRSQKFGRPRDRLICLRIHYPLSTSHGLGYAASVFDAGTFGIAAGLSAELQPSAIVGVSALAFVSCPSPSITGGTQGNR